MLRLHQVHDLAVFVPKRSRGTKDGSSDRQVLKKIGKVRSVVFAPDGRRVVGLLIKRPDIVGMIKREDAFLALDAFVVAGKGIHVTREEDGLDEAARRRLGIEWDCCLLWEGMDAQTTDGHDLGYVNDVEFDEHTGSVSRFFVGEGSLSRQLIGSVEIPVTMLRGYRDGRMLVDAEAASLGVNGGLAGRAGEAAGKVQASARETGDKIATGTVKAVEKGSRGVGKMIGDTKRAYQREAGTPKKPSEGQAARTLGRQLGKVGSLFDSFADEYKKASKS